MERSDVEMRFDTKKLLQIRRDILETELFYIISDFDFVSDNVSYHHVTRATRVYSLPECKLSRIIGTVNKK